MHYAIIHDGTVVNVAVADSPLADNWVSIEGKPVGIGFSYSNGVFVAPVIAMETSHRFLADSAIASGVNITSTATPAINGTFACDAVSQAEIASEMLFILTNGGFTNGASALPWPDITGKAIAFPSPAVFKAWATAVANYVAAVKAYGNGIASDLPSPNITIE